ncbi:hypothetical protein [Oceanobacter mangrovi]|uniref:hypothetical protein n=1 Tax=Oceanobacter mangrovi TaxID=2862510 RepID=UPI001C8E3FC8|nr:hypothetical protein [Oceanobacter mangrovi]
MDVVDRINEILKHEGITRPALEARTGIKVKRWANVLNRQAKPYAEELTAIGAVWPEYAYWLTTGDEIPDAGQISPMTKKAHEASKTAPKAG